MFRLVLLFAAMAIASCNPAGGGTGGSYSFGNRGRGGKRGTSGGGGYSSGSGSSRGYSYNAPSGGGSGDLGSSVSLPSGYSYDRPTDGGGGGGGPSSQYGAPVQAPTIHKHVYVHVPPPDTSPPRPRKPIVVPPPQKHYKIIFIKAPTPPTPTAPVIPVQPKDEQKTLIYVLVKKPEEAPDITIPTPAPTEPNKPEVYFIRYKTKTESAGGDGYPESISPAGGVNFGGGASGGGGSPAATPGNEYGVPGATA